MTGRVFIVAAAIGTATAQVAPPRATPLFQFTADDFWLNLHHYLYVLGRAHNGADAGQPAVASAPDDERQGRAALSDADRASWDEAVSGVRDAAGSWKLTLSGARVPAQRLKTPVMDIWKPYLDGRGTRDEVWRQLLVAAESAR